VQIVQRYYWPSIAQFLRQIEGIEIFFHRLNKHLWFSSVFWSDYFASIAQPCRAWFPVLSALNPDHFCVEVEPMPKPAGLETTRRKAASFPNLSDE